MKLEKLRRETRYGNSGKNLGAWDARPDKPLKSTPMVSAPHFVLLSETVAHGSDGEWRFLLTSADGQHKLVASELENDVRDERLELLSVVRGLEALEQPSRVTLLTSSRYVANGLNQGLAGSAQAERPAIHRVTPTSAAARFRVVWVIRGLLTNYLRATSYLSYRRIGRSPIDG